MHLVTLVSHLDLTLGSKNSKAPAPTLAKALNRCLSAVALEQIKIQVYNVPITKLTE